MVPDRQSERLKVLLLSGDRPDARALGGVAVHVAALALGAPREIIVLSAWLGSSELVVEAWGPRRLVATIPLEQGGLEAALFAALLGTETSLLHVHSPLVGPTAIARAARRAGVPVAVTLHDHALACESYDLLEGGERFCGVPEDRSRCDRCLGATRGARAGAVGRHRAAMGELVDAASAFIAPSDSVVELVARAHPTVRARARRLDWGVPTPSTRSTRSAREPGPLSVAVVAVHSKEKGRERLPELLSRCRALDVTFHLFGATEGRSGRDLGAGSPRVVVHGAYERSALAERLVRSGAHVALLPSIKPETFSLVLSEVTAAGIPVITSDFGALRERVERDGLGFTFDPWAPESLAALLSTLSGDRERVDAMAAHVRALPLRTETDMLADHAALWTSLSGEAPRARACGAPPPLWEAGVLLGRSRRISRLVELGARVRASPYYRDLHLRRLVPEATRKKAEALCSSLLRKLGWR